MRKASTCSELRSSAESPWRRSVEVTKPRSRPCAAMASMASSRRVVSFPLLCPASRRTSGQRARYLWPIRGGSRRGGGETPRVGRSTRTRRDACLKTLTRPFTGPWSAVEPCSGSRKPLAHAVHAGRGFELVRSAIRPQYQSSRSAKYEVPVVVLPSVAACSLRALKTEGPGLLDRKDLLEP